MKNIVILTLLTSCSNQVIVWSMKDVIGLAFLGILILGVSAFQFMNWIENKSTK